MSDSELPELASLVLRPSTNVVKILDENLLVLRRSPRKQKTALSVHTRQNALQDIPQLSASSQQRASPRKPVLPEGTMSRTTDTKSKSKSKSKSKRVILDKMSELAPVYKQPMFKIDQSPVIIPESESEDSFSNSTQPLSLSRNERDLDDDTTSDKENFSKYKSQHKQPTSAMSRITKVARQELGRASRTNAVPRYGQAKTSFNPYVLKEAHCEDLNESSGTDGEDEDTDLSGFIVGDDVELSFHNSDDEQSSDSEYEAKTRAGPERQRPKESPKRRLVRGRRKQISDSEDGADDGTNIAKALDGMHLGEPTLERQKDAARKQAIEIIDLTSSPVQYPQEVVSKENIVRQHECDRSSNSLLNPFFDSNTALKLQPSHIIKPNLLPSKLGALLSSPKRTVTKQKKTEAPTTPDATPPRSPSKTKLNSPTKLLSPSKRTEVSRSPHRQSMDTFWDHNVINQWTDTYSPKKAPTLSPRKNPLARFNLYANDDIGHLSDDDFWQQGTTNSSQDPFDDSSDSLPSPSESPSKSRSPSKLSALKIEQARLKEEKHAKMAFKKKFESEKAQMAQHLFHALDRHITSSKISTMSASTGGPQIIWSKTLRSTAGRANWKRTVQKPSGSPVKGNLDSQSIERQPGVLIQHFASIELAEKIIDRPDRLVNTLAHEFCHLANFMVSGVRDQPHGDSFKRWGKLVTSWLKSPAAYKAVGWQEEWAAAEVTTKHSYVVETKYLWVCIGRPAERQKQTLAMKMLDIENEDDEGCGAEYGRHSKSIDVDTQRCGRCKGFLVQVRPIPRPGTASPKKSPMKRGGALRTRNEGNSSASGTESGSSTESLEKLLEVIELSD